MDRPARLRILVFVCLVVAFGIGGAYCPEAARWWVLPAQWRLDIDAAMDAIGLQPGMIVGEAGAGSGYFTLPMGRRVGTSGAVYANDISRSALRSLESHARGAGLANIHTVLGQVDDPLFPRRDLELLVIVHAFHDFDRPVEWLVNARKYLRPGAVVAIIDRDPGRSGDSHFWSRGRIEGYANKAGFELKTAADVGSDHVILLLAPKPEPSYRPFGLNAKANSTRTAAAPAAGTIQMLGHAWRTMPSAPVDA